MNYTTVQITEERREQITRVQAAMSGQKGEIVSVREVIDQLLDAGLRVFAGDNREPV